MGIRDSARKAKEASVLLGALPAATKRAALLAIRDALRARAREVFDANAADLERAAKTGVAAPLVKRLKFDGPKLDEVLSGIEALAAMDDPVGKVLSARELDAGLELRQVACPIGVIGVVFESRPDALVQISTLCLKSGNAVLLKGGSEAADTNRALADVVARAACGAGAPDGWLHLAETRADVAAMLELDDCIDLLVPRGSREIVRRIMHQSSIPVLGHADGICHVYVDGAADLAMAEHIVVDSKTQYVAVCNAAETLLVDSSIAPLFLPAVVAALSAKGVVVRGCPETRRIVPSAAEATEEDWRTEYLDLVISVRVVDGLDAAIEHINTYGSRHTDAVVTSSVEAAERFMALVDSANVFWNCSTRFADGYRYGLGAEVGISTAKIHARGPVGLEGLVIYKWTLRGGGQIVADYTGAGARKFTHRPLA